jgi:hypothetical protein
MMVKLFVRLQMFLGSREIACFPVMTDHRVPHANERPETPDWQQSVAFRI